MLLKRFFHILTQCLLNGGGRQERAVLIVFRKSADFLQNGFTGDVRNFVGRLAKGHFRSKGSAYRARPTAVGAKGGVAHPVIVELEKYFHGIATFAFHTRMGIRIGQRAPVKRVAPAFKSCLSKSLTGLGEYLFLEFGHEGIDFVGHPCPFLSALCQISYFIFNFRQLLF
ncbi:hypothetical protein DESC_150032 [Desulfosarcina cetonica]|nr:hypothetical protein DESC_150032 [Desulfosarcina cetonica]